MDLDTVEIRRDKETNLWTAKNGECCGDPQLTRDAALVSLAATMKARKLRARDLAKKATLAALSGD